MHKSMDENFLNVLYIEHTDKIGVLKDDKDERVSIILGTDKTLVERKREGKMYLLVPLVKYHTFVCKGNSPSTRKGAATLATQQSLASSKGVCHKMYTFRSSMNKGELSDKYKAMVGTMDVLKPDWDRISKKRRKRI